MAAFPMVSAALLALWLLLNQSLEPAHLLLGAALGHRRAAADAQPAAAWLSADGKAHDPAAPAGMALVEIVRSGLNVGRIILFSRLQRSIPSSSDPAGLAQSVWAGTAVLPDQLHARHGMGRNPAGTGMQLALHVFDLHDEQWWVDTIKSRYEQPLIEIFE